MAALFGLPEDALKPDKLARGPRLSTCIDEFRIEQEQRGNQKRHMNAYVTQTEHFHAASRYRSILCRSF